MATVWALYLEMLLSMIDASLKLQYFLRELKVAYHQCNLKDAAPLQKSRMAFLRFADLYPNSILAFSVRTVFVCSV